LLHAAEHQAAERACTLVLLETCSFQAPGFYTKPGDDTIAILPDCPPEHQKHFLKKVLTRQEEHTPEGSSVYKGRAGENRGPSQS
jgi:hypothetical protein